MTRAAVVQRIQDEKLFAVLRLQRTEKIEELVGVLIDAGISIVEITLNSKDGLGCIHRVSRAYPKALIGAGTVIGYEAATQALEAGAKFLVSPVTDLDMLAVCNEVGVASMAGALTPTEAWQASLAGADFVKLFPLAGLGPQYIRALRGPLDTIRFIPTNGVTVDNIAEFLDAGAVAVGIGTQLVGDTDLVSGDLSIIEDRARRAVDEVSPYLKKNARSK
jgi:2-dehydro-3-deoxyphosphogluconate aldolase/(4S)-4-hydroxy-2-oxoglutarate aldolase